MTGPVRPAAAHPSLWWSYRAGGMGHHTIFLDQRDFSDARVIIEGTEARHAVRVKRVAEGDFVRLVNGRGWLARARVTEAGRRLALEVIATEVADRPHPAVEVWSATPKGPRVDRMIDGLSQVGAAAWVSMACARGVVDPGPGKLDRAARVAIESAKQCLRPWVMETGDRRTFDEALDRHTAAGEEVSLVVADAEGGAYEATGSARIRVLVGPEGGFTAEEARRADRAGAQRFSFGPHVMRIEVAAVVAAAQVWAVEQGA